METFNDNGDERAAAATSFDRTVSYFQIIIGIALGFLLMLWTFLHVNRVTTEPSRTDSTPVQPDQPEIGAAPSLQFE